MRAANQFFGLSRHAVLRLIELGFVAPEKEEGKGWRFSFQDQVLLRSANELRAARMPTRQILRSLRLLKASMPAEFPLAGLRITAEGDRVTVRSAEAHWEPETGQLILDLQLAAGGGSISRMPPMPPPTPSGVDLADLFAQAEQLEESAAHIAEAMYRQILVEDPAFAHAYLNLGFMLCEAGRCHSAAELYEDGVRFCPDDPLMHFNRAVAREGTGDLKGALESYEEAIRLQPDLVDAHRNAALLYADVGQKQMAIRHFNAFRRLKPGQSA
ncbi:tetratricopeptide repeat protein [Variovorax sp. J22G73]|uniref:tetratricopeptide repeat protein n=1 Tax=unclassified Variovorax TaxID=663243 RepID=UPI002577254F|nr:MULTISPECIES: tetratricopeptide repeat protein [unclassified Variovorax]MDM0010598.1 tetratricopeptide repeat protein [Variovorax sp. J22R203]MDM0103073.1 tetratricopeptide repeat protein [Variovorax sp. J22G73]